MTQRRRDGRADWALNIECSWTSGLVPNKATAWVRPSREGESLSWFINVQCSVPLPTDLAGRQWLRPSAEAPLQSVQVALTHVNRRTFLLVKNLMASDHQFVSSNVRLVWYLLVTTRRLHYSVARQPTTRQSINVCCFTTALMPPCPQRDTVLA